MRILIDSISTLFSIAGGQSDFTVHLKAEKYVERGKSLKLHCNNNVKPDILYKVSGTKPFYITCSIIQRVESSGVAITKWPYLNLSFNLSPRNIAGI